VADEQVQWTLRPDRLQGKSVQWTDLRAERPEQKQGAATHAR